MCRIALTQLVGTFLQPLACLPSHPPAMARYKTAFIASLVAGIVPPLTPAAAAITMPGSAPVNYGTFWVCLPACAPYCARWSWCHAP
ncbi:hypothetical protein EON67_07970 [archaeon]|nr:MAG: hypothetical protein EON67_07970 [archaeon]